MRRLNSKLKEKKKGVITCKPCLCVWFSIISFVASQSLTYWFVSHVLNKIGTRLGGGTSFGSNHVLGTLNKESKRRERRGQAE